MSKLKLDLFKVCIIILLSWFGFMYYTQPELGRFVPLGMEGHLILDTKTGETYLVNYENKKNEPWTSKILNVE